MKKYLDKFVKSMIVLLLPMVSYGLLGPLEIFFGNEKDFNFWYTDFYGALVILSVVVWVALALMTALLPDKVYRFVNAGILAVGLGSYVQNMFMNIKLSEADGSPMRWDELGSFTYINLIIWIVIIAVCVAGSILFSKKWNIISFACAGFLSAIQLVAVISLLLTSIGGKAEGGSLQMSGKDQLKVASEHNVIMFVLDTFGTGQMEQAVEKYPDMLDGLQDFTYYTNADCHYYCTFPSMTNMLTGNRFDFEAPLSQEWLAESWNSDKAKKFYQKLHDDGYICHLYSGETGYVYGDLSNLEGKWDNVSHMNTKVDRKHLTKLMIKMSVYRYAPYLIKPRFEVLTKEFDAVVDYVGDVGIVDDNGDFYRMLSENGLTVEPSMDKAFIIQHLFGTHQPYTIDEQAQKVESADVSQTARGLMVIVDEYLSELKKLGIYDNANIIITADHGSWYGSDTQPIFFIKRSGETHAKMEINTAPVSLDDVQATVLNLIGEEYSDYGTSVFDWNPGDTREREVYMRINDDAYPDVPGSSFNVYYGYKYMTDKDELNTKVAVGPDEVIPATPW